MKRGLTIARPSKSGIKAAWKWAQEHPGRVLPKRLKSKITRRVKARKKK